MMDRTARIYVAGHRGLVGSALLRRLEEERCPNVLTRSREDLDLRDGPAVERFFETERPDYVFLAAATVGGILANRDRPVPFLEDNLLIQTHVLRAARRHGVKKLLFLGSSCIYPGEAPVPVREESLLTGPLEPTNRAYAIAKIAGLEACRAYRRQYGANFIAAMPTNLYGPNDNFDLESAHLLPALIRKFDDAKGDESRRPVLLWGSGEPRRELLHVDDLAVALVLLMDRYNSEGPVNVGTGEDLTVREIAAIVAETVGYDGPVLWDRTKPDGTARKVLDVSRIRALGWTRRIGLRDGIRSTYEWYRGRAGDVRKGG